ncbi:MAG: hypothetical protein WC706_05820 [Sideroxydans sp.]|jgi:hypothetical protein
MRITINYFEGYPELEAELVKHSPRARAERLRFLAAMGLAFMRDGRSHSIATHPVHADAEPAESTSSHASPAVAPQAASAGASEVARSITKSIFRQTDNE